MKQSILFITLLAFVLSMSIVPIAISKDFSGSSYDIKCEGSYASGDSPADIYLAKCGKKTTKKKACAIQNFAYDQTLISDNSAYTLLAKGAAKKPAKKKK